MNNNACKSYVLSECNSEILLTIYDDCGYFRVHFNVRKAVFLYVNYR